MGKTPGGTAAELAAELESQGPQGMTKHELAIARRYLRRKEAQNEWAKAEQARKADAKANSAEGKAQRQAMIDRLVEAMGARRG